jgi:hypothetical protein
VTPFEKIMTQQPSALSLMLCDQVIFERGTMKPTLVGVYNRLTSLHFPTSLRAMAVYTGLTDGVGRANLEIVVSSLDSQEMPPLVRLPMTVMFPSPLHVHDVCFRFDLSFPTPGTYLFELQLDDRTLCHRRLRVDQKTDQS